MNFFKQILGKTFFRDILLVCFSTVLLTLSFYSNRWGVVEQERFNNFDTWCKSQVIGRVIKAEKEGIFSDGGFTGWVTDGSKEKMERQALNKYQLEIYTKELDVDVSQFSSYTSQMGGQAWFFAFLDKISPFSNAVNLQFFYWITSFLSALILAFFVLWISSGYGLLSAFITFLFILISPWLMLFGNGIYWLLAVFYLPFVTFLFLLGAEPGRKVTLTQLFLFSLLLVSVKLFFTGFEYITVVLVMYSMPFFYYALANYWQFNVFLKRIITVAMGAVLAIVAHIVALAAQLSIILGSFSKGMNYIAYSFSKRTGGDGQKLPDMYRESLEAGIPEVLDKYLNQTAIDFNRWIDSDMTSFFRIDYGELLLIFIIFSALCFISQKISPSTHGNYRKNMALLLTTWVSVLAPLSWFVIFKGHSYIHTAYNSITWYMPFCLFGFGLTGSIISSLIKDALASFKNLHKKTRRGIIIAITAFFVLCFVRFYAEKNRSEKENREQVESVLDSGSLIVQKNGFDIYVFDNRLWYIKNSPSKMDIETRFFVHTKPCDTLDIPAQRVQYGYDNLDFSPTERNSFVLNKWSLKRRKLVVCRSVPQYEMCKINTGQYVSEGTLKIIWETDYVDF